MAIVSFLIKLCVIWHKLHVGNICNLIMLVVWELSRFRGRQKVIKGAKFRWNESIRQKRDTKDNHMCRRTCLVLFCPFSPIAIMWVSKRLNGAMIWEDSKTPLFEENPPLFDYIQATHKHSILLTAAVTFPLTWKYISQFIDLPHISSATFWTFPYPTIHHKNVHSHN